MQGEQVDTRSDNNCSICLVLLEEANKPVTDLRCGHRFHTDCIEAWRKARGEGTHRLCPNCRRPIAYRNGSNLELSLQAINMRPRLQPVRANMARPSQRVRMQIERNEAENRNNNRNNNRDQNVVAIVVATLVGLGVEVVILYFYFSQMKGLFTKEEEIPVFSAGSSAKGYIAIGLYSEGIISIGLMSQGIFTLSMVGSGILMFIGQLGGGLGFGIYQVGVSWYCYLGQVSIAFWDTRKAQLGINILGPFVKPEKERFANCND